jgi:hypothetical protein
MKFLALFKKDVKCLLPWFIITFAIYIMVVYMFTMIAALDRNTNFSLKDCCMIIAWGLFVFFGFISGLMQFVHTGQSNTWAFLLHRSVSRIQILSSMILSFLFLSIILGSFEFLVFNIFAVAYDVRIDCADLSEWLLFSAMWQRFTMIGLIVYLATVLCSLNYLKWFTTKLFPFVFVWIFCVLVFKAYHSDTYGDLILLIVAVVILLTQITDLFVKKEV